MHGVPDYTGCRIIHRFRAGPRNSRVWALVVLGRNHLPTHRSGAAYVGILLLAEGNSGTVGANDWWEERS